MKMKKKMKNKNGLNKSIFLIYKKMSEFSDLYFTVHLKIVEEIQKEHKPEKIVIDGMSFLKQWNQFTISINDLGYNTDNFTIQHMKNLVKMLQKDFEWLSIQYEVPEKKGQVTDIRELLLGRQGNKDHYNIILRLP